MQDLHVIGVADGALLVASEEGNSFRIPIDEVLHSKLRQSAPEPGGSHKLAPREIQAHIRSGMSAQDVASITGVSIEYIQKFEGPILAEREHVILSALDVPVHLAADTDPVAQGTTFGIVIRERLHGLGAINERWASWKEPATGWVVKLSFTANQVDHDARWQFDHKKLALAPINNEAVTLSQQGEVAGGLIPRLRAVDATTAEPGGGRFDSGAFDVGQEQSMPTRSLLDPVAIRPADRIDSAPEVSHTADLLDALRRRRGEREQASFEDDPPLSGPPSPMHPSTGSIRIVDIPLDDFGDQQDGLFPLTPHPKSARKGRASMPSWDEIVFGARSDDDPA